MMLFVDQPNAAGMAVALLDHRLRQHAEEPIDVGLTDQQIERELDDFRLHPREALRAAPVGMFASQRGAQDLGIAFL